MIPFNASEHIDSASLFQRRNSVSWSLVEKKPDFIGSSYKTSLDLLLLFYLYYSCNLLKRDSSLRIFLEPYVGMSIFYIDRNI